MLCRLYAHPSRHERLPDGRDHQMNTELAWSRDGVTWQRHPNKPAFIDTSPTARGALDWGMGMGNIIEMDDHIRVYYGGCECLHGGYLLDSNPMRSTICLSTLRPDGFVSIEAGDDGGHMLTKPLAYPGGKLHINARTTGDGFIKIAVREGEGVRDGEWPPGFRFDDSVPLSGDSLDHVMTWKIAESLEAFPAKTLRLHFWLENAELYSFRFGP